MSFNWWFRLARQLARPVSRSERRRNNKQHRTIPQFETLEAREVPAVYAPDYVLLNPHAGETPFGSPGPTGYSPAQIRQAYGFNQISFNGTTGDGTGTTIAIVDAYNDPSIKSDLHAFDQQFGLPDPTFSVVSQTGSTTRLPGSDSGWAGEISLDVEWAHAIAPGAHVLLVEANSASSGDLDTAVTYAAKQPGVVAVSMSWGGGEYQGEQSSDSTFVPPSTNPGVVFVNSAGDSGAPASYPSTSPNVLSVGGTTLNLTAQNNYSSESGWSGGGGGISAYESQPSYQKGVVTQSSTMRTSPDVAYDADPNTGFPVYQTYGNSASAPWLQYGGTSDAAPQWAALIAIADQGRAQAGEPALTSATLLPMLYQAPSSDFHDVTTGSSTGSPTEFAGKGYDLVTGRGTPVANLLVSTLVGNSTNPVTHFSITPTTTTVTAGSSFSETVTALNASNQPVAGYVGTVHFTSSDGSAILPPSYTFNSGDGGSHTFTITLKTPGSQTVTATDVSNSSLTAKATVAVTAGTTFSVSGFPTTVTAGGAGSVTVKALAANGTTLTSYSGTVHFTSSDPSAVLPANATLTNGVGTFTVTFGTAGTQSLTATDVSNATITGTESGITVNPGAVAQLIFLQQPSNSTPGAIISPAVTVEELDKYGNVVITDVSSQVSLSLGNAGGATLTGGGAVTVSHGVATFSNLSVSAVGTGYTVTATSGALSTTSATFNVGTSSNVLEDFESGLGNYYYVGNNYPLAATTTAAAHDGTYGLDDPGDGNWYLRMDPGAAINPGDSASVWVNLAGAANGRAYFGFGTSQLGTLSLVMAPNTHQLLIQSNSGFTQYLNLGASNQNYVANQWYRLEVDWGTSGTVVGKLYASNGTTLLNTVTASTGDVTPGYFAFRATGNDKYFDTVTDNPGVNNFIAMPPVGGSGLTAEGGQSLGLSAGFLPGGGFGAPWNTGLFTASPTRNARAAELAWEASQFWFESSYHVPLEGAFGI